MTKRRVKHRRFEVAGAFLLMAAVMAIAGVSCIKRKHSSPVDPVVSVRTPSAVPSVTHTFTHTRIFTITVSPTITPTHTVTWTFTNTFTPEAQIIDDFQDADVISLEPSSAPWITTDSGSGSSAGALSSPGVDLTVTGSLTNDAADGVDWIGYAGAQVGSFTANPGVTLSVITADKNFLYFDVTGSFTTDGAARYRGFRVRVEMADGDIFIHDISLQVLSGSSPVTIDLDNSVGDAGNPTHAAFASELASEAIVGLSFEAWVWDDAAAGSSSATASFSFTLDNIWSASNLAGPSPVVNPPFIDDFEDGDWVSSNGAWWWQDVDTGTSTLTVVNTNADSAPVNSYNFRASGTITNDEDTGTLDGAGNPIFQGWASLGVGTVADPLIGLVAGTDDFIHFWMKGTTLPEATTTNYEVRILMEDGDTFKFRLDYCVSQGIWREFTVDLNDSTPASGNPVHTSAGDYTASEFGTKIVGWSVMAVIWGGGAAGSSSGVYDFSVDAVEFMTSGPADPLPPGAPLFDDFEDMDIFNEHCYDWDNTYTDGNGVTTINTPATIFDSAGGKPASEVLDMWGNMEIPAGRVASAGTNVKLYGPSALSYKQLRFYIKGLRLADILWTFYDDFSMTIYMDDGDSYSMSYIDACYAGGHGTINETTWTQVTIDLTDNVTLVPVPAGHPTQGFCINPGGSNPFHTDFGSETANVSSFTIGQWSSQDPGTAGPWNMQIDELTFIP